MLGFDKAPLRSHIVSELVFLNSGVFDHQHKTAKPKATAHSGAGVSHLRILSLPNASQFFKETIRFDIYNN